MIPLLLLTFALTACAGAGSSLSGGSTDDRVTGDVLDAAQSAYDKFLRSEFIPHFAGKNARGAFVYIDGNNVPELLISAGGAREDGVYVFTLDMDSGEVSEIGDAPFSSYGKISYAEKQNRIVSTYGTENICYQVVSRISGCKSSAVGAVMKDASGYRDAAEAIRKASGKSGDNVTATPEAENAITVHTYYYAGFPLPDSADGTSKDNYLLTTAADTAASQTAAQDAATDSLVSTEGAAAPADSSGSADSGEYAATGTTANAVQAAAGQSVAAGQQTDAVQAAGTEQAEAGAAGSEPAAAAPSDGTEDEKSERGETIEPPGDTFLVDENVYNQSLSDMVNGNKLTEISYDQMQDLSSLKLK